MADPITVLGVTFTLGDALAVVGAIGSIAGGIGARRAGDFNAAVARRDAEIARQRATREEADSRRRSQRILAAQRAGFSAAGVTLEGTPLLVEEESAGEAELDALTLRFGGRVEASRFEARARAAEFGGRAAFAKSLFGAAGAFAEPRKRRDEDKDEFGRKKKTGAGTTLLTRP